MAGADLYEPLLPRIVEPLERPPFHELFDRLYEPPLFMRVLPLLYVEPLRV